MSYCSLLFVSILATILIFVLSFTIDKPRNSAVNVFETCCYLRMATTDRRNMQQLVQLLSSQTAYLFIPCLSPVYPLFPCSTLPQETVKSVSEPSAHTCHVSKTYFKALNIDQRPLTIRPKTTHHSTKDHSPFDQRQLTIRPKTAHHSTKDNSPFGQRPLTIRPKTTHHSTKDNSPFGQRQLTIRPKTTHHSTKDHSLFDEKRSCVSDLFKKDVESKLVFVWTLLGWFKLYISPVVRRPEQCQPSSAPRRLMKSPRLVQEGRMKFVKVERSVKVTSEI